MFFFKILSLYGYSLDGPEPCLIYQYMANGSLADRLICRVGFFPFNGEAKLLFQNGSAPLEWTTRFQIARGVACGLHFLHSIGKTPIIHGDVKPANILLDKHLEPKLGDFGLCRHGQEEWDVDEKAPLIASQIKGTLAYLPPEFISSKILSTKLDVYSFGVVLLEIGTGLSAYSDSRIPPGLVDYVSKQMKDSESHKITEFLANKQIIQGKFNKFLNLSEKQGF